MSEHSDNHHAPLEIPAIEHPLRDTPPDDEIFHDNPQEQPRMEETDNEENTTA